MTESSRKGIFGRRRDTSPSDSQSLSYQELQRLHRPQASDERKQRITDFGENLEGAAATPGHKVIYSIAGQGGTGKTWMLTAFYEAAISVSVPCAWSDDADGGLLASMRRLAAAFDPDAMRAYLDCDTRYQKLVADVLTDDHAPNPLVSALGSTGSRAALALGRSIPGVSIALSFVNDEAFAAQGAEVASYLVTKFTEPADLSLVVDPVAVLSPLFVDGIRTLAGKSNPVALFFDTFEKTQDYMEPWLLRIFSGEYGPVPASVVWSVAGRQELDPIRWTRHEPWIERVTLDVFSDEEARAYLKAHGVVDDALANRILDLTNRLPLFLATVLARPPRTLDEVEDPAATAVSLFLDSIPPDQRELAILAAAPRLLNEDVLAVLAGIAQPPPEGFSWMADMPFVQDRTDGWHYHEVVRAQIFRHRLKSRPSEWADVHARLLKHYNKLRRGSAETASHASEDPAWHTFATEAAYHAVCSGGSGLSSALNRFAIALLWAPGLDEKIAAAISDAGADSDDGAAKDWGERCRDLSVGTDLESAIATLSDLIDLRGATTEGALQAGLFHRLGLTRARMGDRERALADFERASELAPDVAYYHGDRAIALFNLHRYDEAFAAIDLALRTGPEDMSLRAFLLGMRAEGLAERAQWTEAMRSIERALDADSKQATLFLTRARLHAREGDSDSAVEDFLKAIELDERLRHEGLQEIGSIYLEQGRYADAEAALLESLSDNPRCGHCWDSLVAVAARGDPENAVSRILGTEFESAIDERVIVWRAMAMLGEGLRETAEDQLRSVLPNMGEWADSQDYNAVGLALGQLGHTEEAIPLFKRRLDDDPDNAIALYNLAVVESRTPGYEKAADDTIQRATARLEREAAEGSRVVGLYGLAGLRALKGDRDVALKLLGEAIGDDAAALGWAKTDIPWDPWREDEDFVALISDDG